MGEILLSFSDAIDFVILLFLDRLIGLTDRFSVEDFSRDKDSASANSYR